MKVIVDLPDRTHANLAKLAARLEVGMELLMVQCVTHGLRQCGYEEDQNAGSDSEHDLPGAEG